MNFGNVLTTQIKITFCAFLNVFYDNEDIESIEFILLIRLINCVLFVCTWGWLVYSFRSETVYENQRQRLLVDLNLLVGNIIANCVYPSPSTKTSFLACAMMLLHMLCNLLKVSSSQFMFIYSEIVVAVVLVFDSFYLICTAHKHIKNMFERDTVKASQSFNTLSLPSSSDDDYMPLRYYTSLLDSIFCVAVAQVDYHAVHNMDGVINAMLVSVFTIFAFNLHKATIRDMASFLKRLPSVYGRLSLLYLHSPWLSWFVVLRATADVCCVVLYLLYCIFPSKKG